MKTDANTFVGLVKRKAFTVMLISVSAFAAFATMGDGKGKSKKKSILSQQRVVIQQGSFSLKSSYNYQNHSSSPKYIILNSTVSYQKGNTTYIVPVKRKVILEKVSFRLGIQRYNK